MGNPSLEDFWQWFSPFHPSRLRKPVGPLAQTTARVGRSFAQKLVEATRMKHAEADEVGIFATTRHGCIGIASTTRVTLEKMREG